MNDSRSPAAAAHISGIVVHARPERVSEVENAIGSMAGAEVYAREGGKLVVVLEAGDEQGLDDLFNRIVLIENVYSAAIASHYRDEPSLHGDEPCS